MNHRNQPDCMKACTWLPAGLYRVNKLCQKGVFRTNQVYAKTAPQKGHAKPDHHIYSVEYRRVSRSRPLKNQLQDGGIKKLATTDQAVGVQGRAHLLWSSTALFRFGLKALVWLASITTTCPQARFSLSTSSSKSQVNLGISTIETISASQNNLSNAGQVRLYWGCGVKP